MTNVDPFFDLRDVRQMVAKWAVDCGRRVADRRSSLNWDRRQLASMIDTTEATITRIELGQLNPRDHLKLVIASALAVEVEDLWPYPRRSDVFAAASTEFGGGSAA
jgi:DNA-binding XRE family transcriptional regulator